MMGQWISNVSVDCLYLRCPREAQLQTRYDMKWEPDWHLLNLTSEELELQYPGTKPKGKPVQRMVRPGVFDNFYRAMEGTTKRGKVVLRDQFPHGQPVYF